jgi:hypothetical protein
MSCGHGINSIEVRFLGDMWSTNSSVPIEQKCYYSFRHLKAPIATTKYCAGGGQYDCTDSAAQSSRYSVASTLELPTHKVKVIGEMSCDCMLMKRHPEMRTNLDCFHSRYCTLLYCSTPRRTRCMIILTLQRRAVGTRYSVASMLKLPTHKVKVIGECQNPHLRT